MMKVRELIAELEKHNKEDRVLIMNHLNCSGCKENACDVARVSEGVAAFFDADDGCVCTLIVREKVEM